MHLRWSYLLVGDHGYLVSRLLFEDVEDLARRSLDLGVLLPDLE